MSCDASLVPPATETTKQITTGSANCPQFPPPLMSPPAPAPLPVPGVPVSPPPLSASGPSPLPGDKGALSGSR